MSLVTSRDPEAQAIAKEQANYWRHFMTAAEAAAIIGLWPTHNWDDVVRRLALMWLSLKRAEYAQVTQGCG